MLASCNAVEVYREGIFTDINSISLALQATKCYNKNSKRVINFEK